MRIGEFAARGGCDVQTVRFYEREGLLAAPDREASGYRSYADRDLARLQFIRHCRSLDVPLREVRQLLELADTPRQSCKQVDALLDRHIAQVQRRLRALAALDEQLVALRRQCKGANGDRACAIIESFMHATQEHACACHAERSCATSIRHGKDHHPCAR